MAAKKGLTFDIIDAAYHKYGNGKKAAEALGISQSTISYYLRDIGPEGRDPGEVQNSHSTDLLLEALKREHSC